MFLLENRVVTSASDLTTASHCEFAFLRSLDAKLGRIVKVAQKPDAMLDRAAKLGTEHERRVLEAFRAQFGAGVVEIAKPEHTRSGYEAAAAATERAFAARADVVFQATFFDGAFLGFADFIVHLGDGVYEVHDTKLARSAKITSLLQLAAYGDQLHRLGISTGESVRLVLGDGRVSEHRLRDILPVYLNRRARLTRLTDDRVAATEAVAWGDARYSACGTCDSCTPEIEASRDVLLVAGMRLTQRGRLRESGITTIDQLAAASAPVPGLAEATLASLRAQAKLQLEGPLSVDVFNPAALGALPLPDAGDIFFDFEGDPLYSEDGGPEWGIDYLFGLVEAPGPDGSAPFRAFWAHTHQEERRALIDFLDYLRERRRKHPAMHVYHYASYERTHLLSLAARHGVGEDDIDDLLREHVLVDLYPIVKKSLRVGSRSYSIKKLEPLYMGAEQRHGVDNAADSIAEYALSRELLARGETDAARRKLADIADYNEYDCVSTLRLRDWLLARAAEAGTPPATPQDLQLDIPVREPSPVYLALAAAVAEIPPADRTADDTAIALASAAIDYHRREGKKFWQEHFDRLRNPVEQWCDTRDVLVVDAGRTTVHRDWARPPRARTESRVLAIRGQIAPGSSLKIGHTPYLVYDEPFPPIEPSSEPGARYAHARAEITGLEDDVVYVTERLATGATAYDELPTALTPGTPPNPGSQVEAIAEWGESVLDALPRMLPDAALDILRRRAPRGELATLAAIAADSRGGEITAAIRDSLLGIDHSYLAVQGPPGTGKTYTGSRVIADLVVNHGWRIGVVAQSHATVENMLAAVVKAGVDPRLVGKKPKDKTDTTAVPWTRLEPKDYASFTAQEGFVLGGTAWDFSNAARVPRGSLDLLVIDEAGQFSLASTIAAAVSATRMLLLGDPQQLPQVSQGTHPEPVDVSALGWLADGHQVLPPEFGFFLAKTHRLHPDVCAPVSRLSYEDKLLSVAVERHLDGIDPGLHPVPVQHTLNSTSSAEEADRVVEIATSLLGRPWTKGRRPGEPAAAPVPLGTGDLIVVAPYNAQVDLIRQRLQAAGIGEIPVGTVDKFQGHEAAVAIVSLAASSAEEVPRGLEFLLMPNRLNVAISRAQWAAYLLYSPALTEHLPTNITVLARLSAFIELVRGR